MDPGVIGVFIPVIAVGGFFLWMIALSPVGKAYAERMRARSAAGAPDEGREELRQEIEHLRREVAELAERVDFTERLLAKKQGAQRLSPPDRVSG